MKKHYPTANKYVKILEIGALKQGVYESVPSFWAKIQKYGDQLGYTPAQKKTHFLSGVRPDIRDEIYRIGQTKPINDIIDSLAELELRHGILQQAPSQPRHAPIAPAIPDVISQQPVFPMADIQKMIHDAFAQQKTENQTLVKKVTELESQMAKQTQVPAPQTVEPVRQPRGPPSSLQTEEGMENYRLSQYLNNLGIFSTEDFDRNYPIKPFQKPRPERIYSSNQNARIDRIESKVDEIGQMTSQFGRMILDNQSKKPVAKSNSTYRYFPPLIPSQSQYTSPDSDDNEDEEGGYNEEENRWHAPSQSEKKNRYR